ncbi:MAG: hypothetical protein U0795_07785 [Pirellulales bacterium]
MATHPADDRQLADILRASGLFPAEELTQLLERLPQIGAAKLLGEHVREGRLTTWQARRLLAGHSHFQIGHYRLEDQLEQSSAHVVFQARHSDHPAVMRLVQVSVKGDVEEGRREFQRLAALRIPGIVPLVDIHRTSRCWYLAYAGPKPNGSGTTIFQRTLPAGGLELRHVDRLASAVAQAHRLGVADGHLHRDRVVWLDDQPVLLEFGLVAAIHRLDSATAAARPTVAPPPVTPPAVAPPPVASPTARPPLAPPVAPPLSTAKSSDPPADRPPTNTASLNAQTLPIPPLPAKPLAVQADSDFDGTWDDCQRDWRAVGQLVEQWLAESADANPTAQHPDSATVVQLRQWADWLATATTRELSDSEEVQRQLHQETNSAALESGDAIVARVRLPQGAAPVGGTSPTQAHRQARAADWTTLAVTLGLALVVVSAVIGFAAFLLWRTGGFSTTVAQQPVPASPAAADPDAAALPATGDAAGPLTPPVPEGFAPIGGSTNPSTTATEPGDAEPTTTNPPGPDMTGSSSTSPATEPAPAAPAAAPSPPSTESPPATPAPTSEKPTSPSADASPPAAPEGPTEATGGEFETEIDIWPPAEKNRSPRTGLKLGRLEPPAATCQLEWEPLSDGRRTGTWQLASDGPRAWSLKWQDGDRSEQAGLRLEINESGELIGSWQQAEVPSALGAAIANSWLVVRFGDQTRRIQLRKAIRTPTVTLDLQSPNDRRRFELVPPPPENLKLEMIDLGGLMADAQLLSEPTTAKVGKGVQPVQYVLREGAAMRMQVSAEVSFGRRIQVQIVPTMILPGTGALVPYSEAGLAKLAGEINQSYLGKQKLTAEKAAIDRLPKLSRLPEPQKQAMRANYDQQVKVLDEYETAVKAVGTYAERARQAGTLGYRIYADGPDGAQLELIRTEAASPSQ